MRMTKRLSRRFVLNASLALSLLSVTAGWLVTKTIANSKRNGPEDPTVNAILKNRRVIEPRLNRVPTGNWFQQAAPAETTVEQVQKNIKVLTGLPEAQLLPVMNFISTSLGVRCDHCHVNRNNNWDFPSDEKPEKQTAREMIKMVQGINKTSFRSNTAVGCYTCHRGHTSPMGIPQLPVSDTAPRFENVMPGAATKETLPTIDQILTKYTEALGGSAAIDKLKSRSMKGTWLTSTGITLSYEVYQAAPDKIYTVANIPGQGLLERGFNGAIGWEKGARGVRDLGGEQLAYLRRYPDLFKDIKLKEQFARMDVARKDQVDGRDVYVVGASTADNGREQLFFDAQTGLLVRRISYLPTMVGVIPEEIDFEDYHDVDGMKLPFTIRISAIDPFYSSTRRFTEVKLNVPVDHAKFNKPPAPAPAATPAKP
jgi:hypothetical protein